MRPHGFRHANGPTITPGEQEGSRTLTRGDPIEVDGQSYEQLESSKIGPGEFVLVRVAMAPTIESSPRLSASESRIWLDLDAAAMTVDEQHLLNVAGGPLAP